jgi:hypothetical protein
MVLLFAGLEQFNGFKNVQAVQSVQEDQKKIERLGMTQ